MNTIIYAEASHVVLRDYEWRKDHVTRLYLFTASRITVIYGTSVNMKPIQYYHLCCCYVVTNATGAGKSTLCPTDLAGNENNRHHTSQSTTITKRRQCNQECEKERQAGAIKR